MARQAIGSTVVPLPCRGGGRWTWLLMVLLAAAACPADQDQSPPDSQPRSPAESMAAMHVADGFEVRLVAAEPLVRDPVAIAWGPDGKLWVAEMADYPLGVDGEGKAGGRIRYLEDTDGDGEYDRSTLFLGGVGFPNGIMPWRGGVIVTAGSEVFYAEDTDGDGRADLREPLYTGFAEENTQLRVNGLRYGLDGWLYLANGLRTRETIRSIRTGETVELGSRDLRIQPDSGAMDPRSGASQFGRFRDDWGNWFGVHNSYPLWHYVLEDRYLRRNPHVAPPDPKNTFGIPRNPPIFPRGEFIRRYDHPHRGSLMTSACGPTIYRDELLFERGGTQHAFTCEPQHNLIHHRVLREAGATFTADRAEGEQRREFLASEDPWFRPVMARTGPDGALWVVDMYRYLIEHPQFMPPEGRAELEPFFRTGHDRGRIYRIVRKGRSPRPIPRLDGLHTGQLVAALDSPNGWQRDTAQRLLIHRADAAAVPPLETMLADGTDPLARLHALCTLDGMDALEPGVIERALGDAHPAVRRHAVRLAEPHAADAPELVEAAVQLADDPDAKVRLQLACTLGEWGGDRAGEALGRLAAASDDPYLRAAVMSSAVPHAADLVEAVTDEEEPRIGPMLSNLLSMSLAQNDREAMARLLAILLMPRGDGYTAEQMRAFAEWREAAGKRKQSIEKLRSNADDALARQLDRAPDITAAARSAVANAARSAEYRAAAVGLLGWQATHREEDFDRLAALLGPRVAADLQTAAVHALGRIGDERTPDVLLDGWAGHVPEVRGAVLDVLLGRSEWSRALLETVEAGRIAAGEIDAARRNRLLRHGDEAVRESAKELFNDIGGTDRQAVVAAYRSALDLTGDAERGERVFTQACSICHRVGGIGRDIGPNLMSVTDRTPRGLLTAILDPNRAIEPRYMTYTAVLHNGEAAVGILTGETGNSITIRGLDGQPRTLLRRDLKTLRGTHRSLMPEGLEGDINKQEMADLIRFLRNPPE